MRQQSYPVSVIFQCWQDFAKRDEQPVWWWLLPQRCCILCHGWPIPHPRALNLPELCELTWIEDGQWAPILLYTLVKLKPWKPCRSWSKTLAKGEKSRTCSWLPWGQVSWDAASSSRLKLSNMKECFCDPREAFHSHPLPHTAWTPCKADSPSTLSRHWQVFLAGCS